MEDTDDSGLPEAFFSIDCELDGPNPLQHSMRSLGIAVFISPHQLIDTWYATIHPQQDERGQPFPVHPNTKKWWDRFPAQWQEVNARCLTPTEAMLSLANWLKKYERTRAIKWVASPSCVDFLFVKSYYEKYGPIDKMEMGFYCHDLTSLLRSYCLIHNITDQKKFTRMLAGNYAHTQHHALDDAIYQGHAYMNLRSLLQRNNYKRVDQIHTAQGTMVQITTDTYFISNVQ